MSKRALHMNREDVIRPRQPGGPEPAPGERVILLVHGFNNNTDEANESFFTMRQNFDLCLHNNGVDEAVRKRFQEEIWELYWPGYIGPEHSAGWWAKRFYSTETALAYSLQVAKASARVPESLAKYLRARRPSGVFFIGHSLGCRVVLETIAKLSDAPVPVLGFILMAAAVPMHHLFENGSLRRAVARGRHRYCLFSTADTVLGITFPPGQILAQDGPLYAIPVATGFTGWPAAAYTVRTHTGFGHGDYWKEGLAGGRHAYSNLLASVLGIVTDAELTAASIATYSRSQLGLLLPVRTLPSRTLPGRDWLADDYAPART